MSSLAVILARGGSKGIPKKNIIDLNGKPLIYYTIKAALDSGVFDEVVVSTDCPSIASVALDCGAKVPFMRPDELSQDHVWSRDALKHAVVECERIFEKTNGNALINVIKEIFFQKTKAGANKINKQNNESIKFMFFRTYSGFKNNVNNISMNVY